MLDQKQARKIAQEYLDDRICTQDEKFDIVDEATIERDFGWVFFYETREYVESGDEMARAVGNAPLLVDRRSGELHVTGTGRDVEHYIKMYEQFGACYPDK